MNQYLPGQGIAPHVDDIRRFGSYVLAVSLGSDITMRFQCSASGETVDVRVPRRSAYIMEGDARYRWTHGIEKRKADEVPGAGPRSAPRKVTRGTRVSLTYRVATKVAS